MSQVCHWKLQQNDNRKIMHSISRSRFLLCFVTSKQRFLWPLLSARKLSSLSRSNRKFILKTLINAWKTSSSHLGYLIRQGCLYIFAVLPFIFDWNLLLWPYWIPEASNFLLKLDLKLKHWQSVILNNTTYVTLTRGKVLQYPSEVRTSLNVFFPPFDVRYYKTSGERWVASVERESEGNGMGSLLCVVLSWY